MRFSFLLALLTITAAAHSQKIKTTEGDPSVLKDQTSVNIEFNYEGLSVGKFKKEADYIAKKTEEYNKKEAGKGDKWAEAWQQDKSRAYAPQFLEQFLEKSKLIINRHHYY